METNNNLKLSLAFATMVFTLIVSCGKQCREPEKLLENVAKFYYSRSKEIDSVYNTISSKYSDLSLKNDVYVVYDSITNEEMTFTRNNNTYVYLKDRGESFRSQFYYSKIEGDGTTIFNIKNINQDCELYEYYLVYSNKSLKDLNKSERIYIKKIKQNLYAQIISKL